MKIVETKVDCMNMEYNLIDAESSKKRFRITEKDLDSGMYVPTIIMFDSFEMAKKLFDNIKINY